MRRARWKRKGAVSKLAAERKFGEYGSQLFCSKTCFPLRGTGGVRRASSSVRRADRLIKPRGARRTHFASIFAAAPAHLWDPVVRSEAERTGLVLEPFRYAPRQVPCPQMRGRTHYKWRVSAQAAGGFRACMAVRDGGPLVLGELAAPLDNSSPSTFSFDHEWPFSFRQDEKKMGIQSRAALPHMTWRHVWDSLKVPFVIFLTPTCSGRWIRSCDNRSSREGGGPPFSFAPGHPPAGQPETAGARPTGGHLCVFFAFSRCLPMKFCAENSR